VTAISKATVNTGPQECVGSWDVDWSKLGPRETLAVDDTVIVALARHLRKRGSWWLTESLRQWRDDGISPFVEPPPPRPIYLRRRLTAIPPLTTLVCALCMEGV